ncbi:hypothetical protein HDU76_008157 [Blyttiomyces sp. JEL0837]|nr:hypothetical protein HDU76_008157 [Blyttiomyces sp. JEL0837]
MQPLLQQLQRPPFPSHKQQQPQLLCNLFPRLRPRRRPSTTLQQLLSYYASEDLTSHLSNIHNYCFTCGRSFGSSRSLQQHLESEVHKPRIINCPLCSNQFRSLSAVAAHVESGGCPNGGRFNRNTVSDAIRRWEQQSGAPNTFTNKLLENGGNSNNNSNNNIDLDDCYNRYSGYYDCPLCHRTGFQNKNNLREHLNSSRHGSNLYHCSACPRQFVSLSALLKHLELTQCGRQRSNDIASLLGGMRYIGY